MSYRIALGASPPIERRISAFLAPPWDAATFAASQQFAAGRPTPPRGDLARGRGRRSLTARLHGGDLRGGRPFGGGRPFEIGDLVCPLIGSRPHGGGRFVDAALSIHLGFRVKRKRWR